jgi:threonine 3-dehydrogenase
MKALVKTKSGPGIEMKDVPMPTVGHNDVLIKINKTSICGTDLHIYNWDEWAQENITVPLVVGHEFVGEIVELGKEVDTYFKVGDRVSGENHIACGHCRNCRAGRSHLCRSNISVGVTRDGAFADYLSLPAANAYPVPDSVSNSEAAILNPFGNSTHTALSFDLVGEDVLITGAGPVGIMAAAIARHVGARHIVITDVNDYRLTLAEKMGATIAINPTKTTLKQVMAQLNMQEGFDVGLEMSGNASAFNDMISYMNHAGNIALLGFLPNNTSIHFSQIIMKGITIKGIYGREMYDTWYKMITMLQSGLNIAPIITHEFPIADYQKAFDTIRTANSGKIIMNWD